MKIRAVGAAALGPDTQMQQALIGGAQEMMVGSTATLVGITKEMALWDTPFLFNSAKEADAVLDGPIGQKVMDKLQEKGLVGLVYWENGFRNLTNSKRPVTKLEDLDGIKLRVMQNEVYLDSFKTLGANAIPLPFSELFSALETKTVDGQENPYNTILSSKFYEVQKYLSVTNHVYSPWIVTGQQEVVGSAVEGRAEGAAGRRQGQPRLRAQGHPRGSGQGRRRPEGEGHGGQRRVAAGSARMREKLTRVNAAIAANVGMDLWNETQLHSVNEQVMSKGEVI
jgi:tripartite ATP-independent transporter DctP family solute receptor